MDNHYLYWQNLKKDFMAHLESKGYKPLKDYGRAMDLLYEYAATNCYSEYSPEIGYAFWESEKSQGKKHSTLARRKKTIMRLNEYLYGKSYWQKAPRNLRTHRSSSVPPECPAQFAEQFEEFLQCLKQDGLKEMVIVVIRVDNIVKLFV